MKSIEKARTFLDNWILQNIHTTVLTEDKDEAMQLAWKCLQDAEQQHITKDELEAAAGEDLIKCLMDAQKASADARIGELLGKAV